MLTSGTKCAAMSEAKVVIECKRRRPTCCHGRRDVCYGRDCPRCQNPRRSLGERNRDWRSTKPRVPRTIQDHLAYVPKKLRRGLGRNSARLIISRKDTGC